MPSMIVLLQYLSLALQYWPCTINADIFIDCIVGKLFGSVCRRHRYEATSQEAEAKAKALATLDNSRSQSQSRFPDP